MSSGECFKSAWRNRSVTGKHYNIKRVVWWWRRLTLLEAHFLRFLPSTTLPYYQALSRFFLLVVCLVMQNSVNGLNLSKSQCSYVWLLLSFSFSVKISFGSFCISAKMAAGPMRPGRTRCFQLVLPFSSSISNILCAISYARCVIDSRVSLLSSLAPCFCAKERRFRSTARKLISPSLRRPQMDCIYIVDLFLPLLPLVSRVRIVDEDSSIWFDYGPSGRTQGKCEWYASDVRAVGPTATRGIHRNISSSSSSSRTWYQPIPAVGELFMGVADPSPLLYRCNVAVQCRQMLKVALKVNETGKCILHVEKEISRWNRKQLHVKFRIYCVYIYIYAIAEERGASLAHTHSKVELQRLRIPIVWNIQTLKWQHRECNGSSSSFATMRAALRCYSTCK